MKTKLTKPEPIVKAEPPKAVEVPMPIAPTVQREPLYFAIVAEGMGPVTLWDSADDVARFDRTRRGEKDETVLREIGDDPVAFFDRPEAEARRTKSLWIFPSKDKAEEVSKARHASGKDAATKILDRQREYQKRRADEQRQRAEASAEAIEDRLRRLLLNQVRTKRAEAAQYLQQYQRVTADADKLEARIEDDVRRQLEESLRGRGIAEEEMKAILEKRRSEPKGGTDGLLGHAIEKMAAKFGA